MGRDWKHFYVDPLVTEIASWFSWTPYNCLPLLSGLQPSGRWRVIEAGFCRESDGIVNQSNFMNCLRGEVTQFLNFSAYLKIEIGWSSLLQDFRRVCVNTRIVWSIMTSWREHNGDELKSWFSWGYFPTLLTLSLRNVFLYSGHLNVLTSNELIFTVRVFCQFLYQKRPITWDFPLNTERHSWSC